MEKIKITKSQQAEVSTDNVRSVNREEKVLSEIPRRKPKSQLEEVCRGSNYRTYKRMTAVIGQKFIISRSIILTNAQRVIADMKISL